MFTHYFLGFSFTSLVILFPYLTTPLSMGCCLLLLTVLMALNGSLMYTNLWLSYILVLVFLGGLLVIFIYIALVSSNERFSLTFKPLWITMTTIPAFFTLPLTTEVVPKEITLPTYSEHISMTWMSPLYSKSLYLVTLFLVMYLFLTLIVVVSNTKSTKMTLRSF